MITDDTAVGSPPPRVPFAAVRAPLPRPPRHPPYDPPPASGPGEGRSGVRNPDPRGQKGELAKNRQFFAPYGAESRGSGGAPPTNLILLRNQRTPPRARPRARVRRRRGAQRGSVAVGGHVPPPPHPKTHAHPAQPDWSGARPGVVMAPCAGKVSPPLRYRFTAARRQACLALPRCSGRVKSRRRNDTFLRPLPAEPRPRSAYRRAHSVPLH